MSQLAVEGVIGLGFGFQSLDDAMNPAAFGQGGMDPTLEPSLLIFSKFSA